MRPVIAAACVVAVLAAPSPCSAADAPESPAAPADAFRTLADAEAAALLEGLKKAARARSADDALPALDALAGVTHPGFEPLLAKLLQHPLETVAGRAAREMGLRAGAKTAASLWKAWIHPVNDKRWDFKAAVLRAWGRMKAPLDAKQYDEVKKVWVQAVSAPAMEAFAAYFEAVAADKRPCRLLALWLDEPRPGNVDDGNNPPASWWEARWKLWQSTKPAAVAALKAITGQSFGTSEEAKTWFEANPKFGVKW